MEERPPLLTKYKKDARNVVDIKLFNNNWGQQHHYSIHTHDALTQYCNPVSFSPFLV
jgi:hypothetical protein